MVPMISVKWQWMKLVRAQIIMGFVFMVRTLLRKLHKGVATWKSPRLVPLLAIWCSGINESCKLLRQRSRREEYAWLRPARSRAHMFEQWRAWPEWNRDLAAVLQLENDVSIFANRFSASGFWVRGGLSHFARPLWPSEDEHFCTWTALAAERNHAASPEPSFTSRSEIP